MERKKIIPESQEEYKTGRGCAVILYFVPAGEVLFMRRDDIPVIDFPGYLDLFGGFVEEGEDPDDAIEREVSEELVDEAADEPYSPDDIKPFKKYVDNRGCEQNFYGVELHQKPRLALSGEEGQYVVWMNRKQIEEAEDIAWEFKEVILEYLDKTK